MRYSEFYFENFKGIEDMTVPLTGDVTTLIGLNESGKTTILEAIFCFSYGTEDLSGINPGLTSLRDPQQWIPIALRANFNKDIVIRAKVTLDDADKAAYRKHMKLSHDMSVTDIPDEIEIREEYHFANSKFTKTNRYWNINLRGRVGREEDVRSYDDDKNTAWIGALTYFKQNLPRIYYFPNFLFELPERFVLGDQAGLPAEERDKNAVYRTTFEQILEELNNGAELQTHVVQRLHSDERADQKSLSALLLDMSRVITKTVFGSWDRIFGRAPVAQEVELLAEADSGTGAFLELRIKGPDGYYDLSERSLGFRWFFMFLMMTSFQKVARRGQRSLFLLDEPASNLHSSAQAELLKSFENLLDRCSLIYTTHSHHLINVRWLDSAFVVKNAALSSLDLADYMSVRMGSHTSISAAPYRRFVNEHPDQTSYFQPVLDLLDYRPSTLEPVPSVVLVEGKSDFYLIRYLVEVLGLASDLHYVPGTGAGSLDTVIRLHVGWAKPFIVLLDGDAEGQKQLGRYEREFGPVLAGRCVLLPVVAGDATVKEIEDLLSSEDKKNLIAAVFADGVPKPPGKKALYQAIIELYAARRPIMIDAATRSRFVGLMGELERRLGSS
jgi:predicted ATPase